MEDLMLQKLISAAVKKILIHKPRKKRKFQLTMMKKQLY